MIPACNELHVSSVVSNTSIPLYVTGFHQSQRMESAATGATANHTQQIASPASSQIQPNQLSIDEILDVVLKVEFSTLLNLFPRSNDLPYQPWSDGTSATAVVSSASNSPVFQTPTAPRANHRRSNSPVVRKIMTYMAKFGGYGNGAGQFTEPSSVTVDGRNRILVADTKNHRIQMFNVFGHFDRQFGQAVNFKLNYPNRIAVSMTTSRLVITERAPSNRVQTYTLQGRHLFTFGVGEIKHPRGLAIDNNDNMIIVECKVMMVIILNREGQLISRFGCSRHVIFPNSVAVNHEREIFISDNRGHNVQVFNYEGILLRTIGGEGLTNYPIAVAINQRGEVVVADNHNSFNLTVFTQQGELVAGYESKTKHAECLDVALTNDGVAILTSSDFNVYCYPYQDDCPYLQNH